MKRAVLVLALTVLGGCGSSKTATTTVVTVIQQAPAPAATTAAEDPAPNDSTESNSSSAAGSVSDDGSGGHDSAGEISVPDEVGKQHQAAQDDLQAHGLFNLSEEDATGEGRLLIIDRNWKVVSQSPAAGTKVSEDATITLRSKKYTDP
jgi:beta-lactam-binding protein with PASTA domain